MATVASLTEARIQELMSGWVAVGLSQEEINTMVIELRNTLDENQQVLDEFNNVTMPQLQENLAGGAIDVANLNDNVIPGLQADLSNANAALDILNTILVPNIQNDLESTIINVNERPNVYVQDEAPTNPDDDDRYLVVGDSWFDSNDGNKQRVWNGVEWSTFNVDVADFSLTVRKFISTKHQLY